MVERHTQHSGQPGGRTQLGWARIALERIGDRQFLRKLDAVAAELAGAAPTG
jgi:hypothetical protein